MEQNLIVNEIYDKLTVQGEGPSVGQLCTFIRLGTCSLRCVWCDTAYTWRFTDKYPHVSNIVYDPKEELHPMTYKQILDKLLPLNPPMIIISGGEPMLQAEKLGILIPFLISHIDALTRIEIETAGTIFSNKLVDLPYLYFNVSPKLANSGNPKDLRYKPDVLEQFVYDSQSIFKFVVCNEFDFDEIEEIVKEVKIPRHRIYVMPEGISSEVQTGRMQFLVDEVIKRRWNLTPRLHVMIWQNRRGV